MPPCDFFDLSSVAKTARFISEKYLSIDLLINNAGLVCMEKGYNSDGIENTFSVNHLAHFILTLHLLPNLKRAKNPRIITTSSEAHYHPNADFLVFPTGLRADSG